MKILLTGATGYIGKRLLPALIEKGYRVVCCVRDVNRFHPPELFREKIEVIEVDFLDRESLKKIPTDIDGAYYLMHSMSASGDYESMEMKSAVNFVDAMKPTKVRHVVYLTGMANEKYLSKHLSSRMAVENELSKGDYHFTALRAGIIIGSGSASFEIIRDLTEKLPVMITPKWLNTLCQPIGIRDVISFLCETLFTESTYDRNFDIGGPDILTYKDMLLEYAKIRGLKRKIFPVPVLTPKLSAYWLYFITSTTYKLARALVSSMKVEVVCRNHDLNKLLDITPAGYREALRKTLHKIEENQIVSSWKDSLISGRIKKNISEFLKVPTFGCFIDKQTMTVKDRNKCIEKIWKLGGETGWYSGDRLWKLRGTIDKLFGGVGLRRGRTHVDHITTGDALDFWRVLYANKEEGRMLLYAEMKLPGEAWLEFKITENKLEQIATFRPKGVWGRLYWYAVYPFHGLIFKGMIKKLAE